MNRKSTFLIPIILTLLSVGCARLYTADQVNSTVSAKIKEVAGYQKVNVTVETIIVKEYVVVTATPRPTMMQPLPYETATPVGFNRYKAEDVFAQLAINGYQIRQYYFDLSKEDLGTAGNYIKSASNFAVDTGAVSYNGIIFSFENEENLLKAYDILNIAPIQENGSLFRVGNFLIEMENETIRPILDQLGTLSVTFNQ